MTTHAVHDLTLPTLATLRTSGRSPQGDHTVELWVTSSGAERGWVGRCIPCDVHVLRAPVWPLDAALRSALRHTGANRGGGRSATVLVELCASGYRIAEILRRAPAQWAVSCGRGPGGWGDGWYADELPTLTAAVDAWSGHVR